MNLTYDDVAQTLAILDMAEGKDLEFSLGGRRVTLVSWSEEAVAARAPIQAQPKSKPAAPRPDPAAGLFEVRARRLGYYQSCGRIRAGLRVSEGDAIGLLVGLKEQHDVQAPVSGQVVEIWVGEQEFVEYGQCLLTIDTLTADADTQMSGDSAADAVR